MKVFSQCASCGKGIEGGDNVYICEKRVYCCKECFAKNESVSYELHCLVEKYLSGFEKILDENTDAEPLFILEDHKNNHTEIDDYEKPRYMWSNNIKYVNSERKLSINYEERYIILNSLALLEDACKTSNMWEKSGDVRRLMRRFASENWED